MFQIDNTSKVPVYEQLIEQVSDYILAGILKENDALPSFRTLSVQLSVNPNTIRKVYEHLEIMGITYTQHGKGVFVSPDACRVIRESLKKELPGFEKQLKKFKMAGIRQEDIMEIVRRCYDD
ncbi:MAG: GntR family transcriptional regulator [Lachnospiraceae bacterium]